MFYFNSHIPPLQFPLTGWNFTRIPRGCHFIGACWCYPSLGARLHQENDPLHEKKTKNMVSVLEMGPFLSHQYNYADLRWEILSTLPCIPAVHCRSRGDKMLSLTSECQGTYISRLLPLK